MSCSAIFAGAILAGCSGTAILPSSNEPVQPSKSVTVSSTPPPKQAPAPVQATLQGNENRLYYPTGERDTSMLMLERTGPAQARLGKPYDYHISVTNLTNQTLQGVTVSEILPGSFAVTSQDAPAEHDHAAPAPQPGTVAIAGQRTHVIGELKAKESRTLNLTALPSKEGSINTCTSVTCNPTLCMATMVVNPQMKLIKEAVGSGDLCEPQILRYTIKNTGTGDLTGVRIEDQLPEGLAMLDKGASRISTNVGTITPGQTKTVDIKVKAAGAGKFSSAATAVADNDVTAKSEALALAINAPQFEVALKAPEKEYLGHPMKYEVTVKNIGTATARSPKVRIDSAADVAAGNNGDNAQTASAKDTGQTVGEIEPGKSKTVTVEYNPKAEGDLRVNAVVTDPCAKTALATGVTHIAVVPALQLSAVDDHDPVRVGDNVTYTITVLNQGFGADKNIHVVVTLPEGEQYVSSDGPSKAALDGSKLTFEAVPTISPKQSLVWKLVVKATKAADVRLRVDMQSDSFPDAAIKVEPTRLY